MSEYPEILEPARRHGIADNDTLHAWRHGRPVEFQDTAQMIVGPDPAGNTLELGYDTERHVIFHSMKARQKYLPRR
ncbi:MAG: hypothetical protein GY929_08635 [Actinomycetia bacterium]|nr:hypothetical protein [Actinomycetes bacterium]